MAYKQTSFKMIGLMSGTSGDGLDIAYCEFNKPGPDWQFELKEAITIPFPDHLEKRLGGSHLLSAEALAILDMDFGAWMGKSAMSFCQKNNLKPDAIASHGHTVFHQPHNGISVQIGNGWSLHCQSGFPVINDFRSLDVILGGQGAPLVPVGDLLLFGNYEYCLNLGGIANISMNAGPQRIAFDICPFNLLLNHFVKKTGPPFDDKGRLAKTGQVDKELLHMLSNLAFYQKSGAKSLGRENIDQEFLPLLENSRLQMENILATLVEHFSFQISKTILGNYNSDKESRLLITGGGAYHQFFIEKLTDRLKGRVRTVIPEPKIIEFKEALIFAFLGALRLRNETNTLSSVTGAVTDSCGGVIYGNVGVNV